MRLTLAPAGFTATAQNMIGAVVSSRRCAEWNPTFAHIPLASNLSAPGDVPSRADMAPPVVDRINTGRKLAGCRVLIVDDNQPIQVLYRTALSLAAPGIGIATAGDGIEALRLAQELPPDVVLMDLAMPRMDGLEATRRLKADARTSHVRVIAISGTVYDSSLLLAAGCDGYLIKPATPDQVMCEMVRVLGL